MTAHRAGERGDAMKFQRDDFIPEGGTLTVRYLAIDLGCENSYEIRIDAQGVEFFFDGTMARQEDIFHLSDIIQRAAIHHEFLKRDYELMSADDEPACVVKG